MDYWRDVIEVESKYRSPGNEQIRKVLSSLNAKVLYDGAVEDLYFAHPERDYGKTDEALRLRVLEGAVELTYKGPRMREGATKAREEVTCGVKDQLEMRRILERLGFVEQFVVRKQRSSFLLDKLRVEVDFVEGLGEFVELELVTEEPKRAHRLLEMARKELGLEQPEPRTYYEMLVCNGA